jgi:hypothetical protein
LNFNWALMGEELHRIEQRIGLIPTRPNYGGLRWWMRCPATGQRATKLYKPPGQERFASRRVWRLGYRSQRAPRRDQPFERLYRSRKNLEPRNAGKPCPSGRKECGVGRSTDISQSTSRLTNCVGVKSRSSKR